MILDSVITEHVERMALLRGGRKWSDNQVLAFSEAIDRRSGITPESLDAAFRRAEQQAGRYPVRPSDVLAALPSTEGRTTLGTAGGGCNYCASGFRELRCGKGAFDAHAGTVWATGCDCADGQSRSARPWQEVRDDMLRKGATWVYDHRAGLLWDAQGEHRVDAQGRATDGGGAYRGMGLGGGDRWAERRARLDEREVPL